MPSLFRPSQLLKGKAGTYTITKHLHEFIWLATTHRNQTVIIKSIHHFRLANERDVLKRFQSRIPSLRRLVDEIDDPSDPPALVLEHLDDDLLTAAAAQRLTGREIKRVARKILEALAVLHEDGYVHTDIKPDNILVNYGKKDAVRFADVKLADCGNTVRVDSVFAQDRALIGAPIWRSPEAQLGLAWGTATDIWSLGAVLITLIWGDNWYIFKPDVPADHEEYELRILMRQHQFFGPFPLSYKEIADGETLAILTHVMRGVPRERMKPFGRVGEGEIGREDRAFILKLMKLDPRDRPTAGELLGDEWFAGG